MRAYAVIVICVLGFLTGARAEMNTPTRLNCEFGYISSAVAGPDTRYFVASIDRATEADFITFYNIDLVSGRAEVAGARVDSEMVIVSERRTNWTFTEFTDRGDTYVTQVFREFEPGGEGTGIYRVVRSRQWTEFGSVYARQYYGVCATSDDAD